MLNVKFIGTGAAGVASVIDAIEEGSIQLEDALLLNTTIRDIPLAYKDKAFIFGEVPGCGKERNVSKEQLSLQIQNGFECLDNLVDPTTQLVIISASTEGGTGSGSAELIARYYREVYGISVIINSFTGFEDDARGMANTVEFFTDLIPERENEEDEEPDLEVGVQIISNKKFLSECKGNKIKAEMMANADFVNRARIIQGLTIRESSKNIDITDLVKTVTTPGYMTIESCVLDSHIKNTEQLNKSIKEALDNSSSLDSPDKKCIRAAVIVSVKQETMDYLDFDFTVIRDNYGEIYELFTHIQCVEDDEQERIDIIAAGMKMPLRDIEQVYDRYKKSMEKVNTSKDAFFNKVGKMSVKNDSFNTVGKNTTPNSNISTGRASFLSKLNTKPAEQKDLSSLKEKFLAGANVEKQY